MAANEINALKDIYIPVASSVIALASVFVAYLTLRYSRKDREEARQHLKEQEKAAEAALRRNQQEEIFAALQGEKESIGFMALQLSRNPELVSSENRDAILSSLCLAYVFNSSSRARALSLKALRVFSEKFDSYEVVLEILQEIKSNFAEYQKLTKDDTSKYKDRLGVLTDVLEEANKAN